MIDLSFLDPVVQGFMRYAQDTFIALLNIPPSLSLPTAITLTFAWLFSEFASTTRIMRGLVAAAWALTIGNSFLGARSTVTLEFWILVGVVMAVNLAWVSLRGRRGGLVCSSCSNSSRFDVTMVIKRHKAVEFEAIRCANCGSSDVQRTRKV